MLQELLPRRSEKRCTGRWAASVIASLGLSLVSLALALGPLDQGFHRSSKTNGFLRLALDQQDRPWTDNSSVLERGRVSKWTKGINSLCCLLHIMQADTQIIHQCAV